MSFYNPFLSLQCTVLENFLPFLDKHRPVKVWWSCPHLSFRFCNQSRLVDSCVFSRIFQSVPRKSLSLVIKVNQFRSIFFSIPLFNRKYSGILSWILVLYSNSHNIQIVDKCICYWIVFHRLMFLPLDRRNTKSLMTKN